MSKLKKIIARENFLREIMVSFFQSLEIKNIIKTLTSKTGEFFSADQCFFFRYDDKNKKYIHYKDDEVYLSPSYCKLNNFSAKKFTNGELESFNTITKDSQDFITFNKEEDSNIPNILKTKFSSLHIESGIMIPFYYQNTILGLLFLSYTKRNKKFDIEEKNFLDFIANYSVGVIYQAQLVCKLKVIRDTDILLKKIIESIRSSLDINQTFEIIGEELIKLLDADRVSIAKVNIDMPEEWILMLEHKARENIKGIFDINFNREIGTYNAHCLKEGRSLIFSNISESNVPDFYKKAYEEMEIKSLIGIPIQRKEDKWGILFISKYKDYHYWTEDEINLLETIADEIYIAIEQAELYSATKKQVEREALLRKITEKIRSSLDINETLTFICDEVAKLYNVQRATIVEFPNPKNYEEYIIRREYKINPEIRGLSHHKYLRKLAAYWGYNLLKKKSILAVDNIALSDIPDYFKNAYNILGVKSILGLPIKKDDDEWGTLGLSEYNYNRHWSEEDKELLRTISGQIYIAIKQAELYSKTNELATREILLRKAIEAIRSTLDITEIKKKLLKEIVQVFKPDRAFIIEFNNEKKQYQTLNKTAEYTSSSAIPSYVGVNLYSLPGFEYIENLHLSNKAFVYNDMEKYIEENNLKGTNIAKFLRDYKIKAVVAVNVTYGNVLLGNIVLHYAESQDFGDEDIKFLQVIADQVGIALNQVKLYVKIINSAQKEKILRKLVNETRLSQTVEETYNYITYKLAQIFNINKTFFVQISDFEPKKPVIKYEFHKIQNEPSFKDIEFPEICVDTLLGLLSNPRSFCLNDISTYHPESNELQSFFKKNNVKSILASPLVKEDKKKVLLGAFVLCSNELRVWSKEEIDLFESILNSIITPIWEITKRTELDELRNTFILTLAHDLEVPLVGERRALEFIMSIPPGQLLDKYKDIIGETIKSNKNISNFLKKLVDIYTYELNRKKLYYTEFNFLTLIDQVIEAQQDLAKQKAINIDINYPKNLPLVCLDKEEMKKVINTLLENAIIYTNSSDKINIKVELQDVNIVFYITDNGIGMSEEEQKRLFKPYEMALSTKRKIGAGLGLYLAKQIIKSHGGNIWFMSEKNKGTTFCFSIPIKKIKKIKA